MTHTYANLSKIVTAKKEAIHCAKAVPLVYCVRKSDDQDQIFEIFRSGYLGGPFIAQKQSTRNANKSFGIKPGSTFLYAGRAFPETDAHIFLLFSGTKFDDSIKGGARPFDSGALDKDLLKLDWRKHAKGGKKEDYFKQHNLTNLAKWRNYFGLFIEEFFHSATDYWDKLPTKAIDGKLFKDSDDWRNWAFEVHSETTVDLKYAKDIIVDDETFNFLLNEVQAQVNPAMASIIGEKCRWHHKPREEAEDKAKYISIS